MSVSIIFEVQVAGEDVGGPLDLLLRECDKLPYNEREHMIGQLMVWDGIRRIEKSARSKAVDDHYKQKNERAAATRAQKKEGTT